MEDRKEVKAPAETVTSKSDTYVKSKLGILYESVASGVGYAAAGAGIVTVYAYNISEFLSLRADMHLVGPLTSEAVIGGALFGLGKGIYEVGKATRENKK